MSVKIRKGSHGLLPWAAKAAEPRQRLPRFGRGPPKPTRVQRNAPVSAMVRQGRANPRQSMPESAKASAKPPKPAKARQTSAKTQRRQSQREHAKKTSVVRGSHFEKYVMKMADVGGVRFDLC
jgi:hypothetical protein